MKIYHEINKIQNNAVKVILDGKNNGKLKLIDMVFEEQIEQEFKRLQAINEKYKADLASGKINLLPEENIAQMDEDATDNTIDMAKGSGRNKQTVLIALKK